MSLTNSGWFGSFGLDNDSPTQSNSTPQSSNANEQKEEYFISMDPIRRKKGRKSPEEHDSALYSFNVGIIADAQLKKVVEREQNTRRLTLEREERKRSILRRQKREKRIFDMALLITTKNKQYHKILCGPIIYEAFYGHIRFTNSQQYINKDIDILDKCAEMVEEIDGSAIFQYFCNYSPHDKQNGVTFHFADISKCQFYRFMDNSKYIWDNHKNGQAHIKCDVLVIVNTYNVPIYILLDVHIDLIEETIQFFAIHEYENGDDQLLQSTATQLIDFQLKRTYSFYKLEPSQVVFEYNFSNTSKSIFKFAVCHNFRCLQGKQAFYHQTYDIALTTNDNDELMYVLHDVQYDSMNRKMQYTSSQMYRNGDYQQLKEYGEEIKCIKIKHFESKTKLRQSKCDLNSSKQCILFHLKNVHLWSEYIEKQKQCHFDVATITDCDDYQIYILSNVTVNWIDQIIDFAVCDTFKARHNKIIQYYGEFVVQDRICDFTLNGFNNEALSEIFFFQLKSHSNHRTHNANANHNNINTQTIVTVTPPKDKPELKKVHTFVNMTQRDSIMPDRMSVLASMHTVSKMKQRLLQNPEKSIKTNKQKTYKTSSNKYSIHLNDEWVRIWNSYIDLYGFEPDNPRQLRVFSRTLHSVKPLSYSEARIVFKYKKK